MFCRNRTAVPIGRPVSYISAVSDAVAYARFQSPENARPSRMDTRRYDHGQPEFFTAQAATSHTTKMPLRASKFSMLSLRSRISRASVVFRTSLRSRERTGARHLLVAACRTASLLQAPALHGSGVSSFRYVRLQHTYGCTPYTLGAPLVWRPIRTIAGNLVASDIIVTAMQPEPHCYPIMSRSDAQRRTSHPGPQAGARIAASGVCIISAAPARPRRA